MEFLQLRKTTNNYVILPESPYKEEQILLQLGIIKPEDVTIERPTHSNTTYITCKSCNNEVFNDITKSDIICEICGRIIIINRSCPGNEKYSIYNTIYEPKKVKRKLLYEYLRKRSVYSKSKANESIIRYVIYKFMKIDIYVKGKKRLKILAACMYIVCRLIPFEIEEILTFFDLKTNFIEGFTFIYEINKKNKVLKHQYEYILKNTHNAFDFNVKYDYFIMIILKYDIDKVNMTNKLAIALFLLKDDINITIYQIIEYLSITLVNLRRNLRLFFYFLEDENIIN